MRVELGSEPPVSGGMQARTERLHKGDVVVGAL